jgi:GNAT superfamily N-acetyltransferase
MSDLTFDMPEQSDPADVEFVHSGLRRHNAQFVPSNYRPLNIFLREDDGRIVGGLLGHLYWGWLSVETLWMDEAYRGQGLGGRLLDMAEEEARRHGCAHVQLDTLTFQARPFYEARGYRVYGELADFPAGTEHRRFYLTKQL